MRIPDKYLPHRITIEPLDSVGGSMGKAYGAPRPDIHALVVDKRAIVVDQRTTSETNGREITSSTQIVMQKEDWVGPDARVRINIGTPAERIATVVTAGYNDHPTAPNSAQLWLI